MDSLKDRARATLIQSWGWLSRWLRRSPLGAAFLDDPLLAAATGVLAIITIALLFVTPILPYSDHGVNVGAASLLLRAATHEGVVGYHYSVNYAPVPYWTTYLGTALVSALAGPLIAAKVLSAVCSLTMPLALMRLMIALRRSPRLGLWAFVFAYDLNLHWGWANYLVGMALAFVAVAWLLEAESYRDAAKIIPLAALISLSHIHAVGVFGLLGSVLILTREKPLKALGLHAIAMSGMSIVILPWFWKGLSRTSSSQKFSAEFPPVSDKISHIHDVTLDITAHPLGAKLTAWAFIIFVVGLMMLAAAPSRECPNRSKLQGAVIFLVLALLYVALPFQVNTPFYHTFTYTRLGSFVLLTALLVPCVDFSRWRALWLVPGLVSVFLMFRATETEFKHFGKRVRPYLDIIAAMEPNKRFFPLDTEMHDPAVKLAIYHMIHGYAAAMKQSFDPHLFDFDHIPLHYRRKRNLPVIDWNRPRTFNTDDHGIYYDYIIVKGLKADPVRAGKSPKGPVVERVLDSGDWRLYKVTDPLRKDAPPEAASNGSD